MDPLRIFGRPRAWPLSWPPAITSSNLIRARTTRGTRTTWPTSSSWSATSPDTSPSPESTHGNSSTKEVNFIAHLLHNTINWMTFYYLNRWTPTHHETEALAPLRSVDWEIRMGPRDSSGFRRLAVAHVSVWPEWTRHRPNVPQSSLPRRGLAGCLIDDQLLLFRINIETNKLQYEDEE